MEDKLKRLQHRLIMHVTMSMATSQVEVRIRALMQTRRKRDRMTGRSVAVTAFVAATILLPLAAMRPVAQAEATLHPPIAIDRGPLVVVDAGHGGQDTGAVGLDGTFEKDINLAIAGKLRNTLTKQGARVIMTRIDDTYSSLTARSAFVRANGAQYLVSIHCDNKGQANARSGITAFYHGTSSMGRTLGSDVLRHVARDVVSPTRSLLSDTTRFPLGFSVLRNSAVPCVLVECGYMNNAHDLTALHQERTQQQIADGIAAGLEQFNACYKPIQAKLDYAASVHAHNARIVKFWDSFAAISDTYLWAVQKHKPELIVPVLAPDYVFNGRTLNAHEAVKQLQGLIDKYGSRNYNEKIVHCEMGNANNGLTMLTTERWGSATHGKAMVTLSRRDVWRITPSGWRLVATEER